MKTLYNTESNEADTSLTQTGLNLDREMCDFARALIQRYMNMGYSPREIPHVLTTAVWDSELYCIMNRQAKAK